MTRPGRTGHDSSRDCSTVIKHLLDGAPVHAGGCPACRITHIAFRQRPLPQAVVDNGRYVRMYAFEFPASHPRRATGATFSSAGSGTTPSRRCARALGDVAVVKAVASVGCRADAQDVRSLAEALLLDAYRSHDSATVAPHERSSPPVGSLRGSRCPTAALLGRQFTPEIAAASHQWGGATGLSVTSNAQAAWAAGDS
jgi:hypothetical protein